MMDGEEQDEGRDGEGGGCTRMYKVYIRVQGCTSQSLYSVQCTSLH